MATSKIDIINRALVKIGSRKIASIAEDSEPADIMNTIYNDALKSVLYETDWSFATKRALLSQVSGQTPAWTTYDLSYTYQKPSDCIRVWGWNNISAVVHDEGDYIRSDSTGLGIKYTYLQENPNRYTPPFVDALSDKLAYEASFAIVTSKTTTEKLYEIYTVISLPDAIAKDAQLSTPDVVQQDEWVNAKYTDGANYTTRETRYR